MPAADKNLLNRLPRTFVPTLNEQLRQWDLLFPAEQRSLRATLDHLTRLPAPEFQRLFAPIKDLERKMELPRWNLSTQRATITDISLLVRSPHYPQWRMEVERVFEEINTVLESASERRSANRLILCMLPAGLPIDSSALFPRLEKQGRWVRLPVAFGQAMEDLVRSIAGRRPLPDAEAIERTWALECRSRIAAMPEMPGLTALSYESLTPVRKEFLRRLNAIRKDLRSADQAYDDLRRLDITRLLDARLRTEPRIRQFITNLFLSGNGALLFNNSFIQWGSAELLRRVQPQVLIANFGIRQRPKPFSSMVLFEDQNRANPIPEQPDPAGSLIDIQMLSEYVCLAANRLSAYRGHTLFIFAAAESDRVLILAPSGFTCPADHPQTGSGIQQLHSSVLAWLSPL